MSDLATLVEPFKRTVALPGTFAATYPDTTDGDIAALLADAFARAQLDGFFPSSTYSVTNGLTTPDLSPAEQSLVLVYAEHRFVSSEMRNLRTHVRYEAGPTVFEQDRSAQLLRALYDDLSKTIREIRDAAAQGATASAFLMADLYVLKASETSVTDFHAVHVYDPSPLG